MTTAVRLLFDVALARGYRPRPTDGGRGFKCVCPLCQAGDGRGDHDPALHVQDGTEAPLIFCHAGCGRCGDALLDSFGLTWADVMNGKTRTRTRPAEQRETGRWTYVDEAGQPLFDVVRLEPGENGRTKTYRQRLPGMSTGGISDTRRVLYRLPDLLAAIAEGEAVWIHEGERCADVANADPEHIGMFHTTPPGGAPAFDASLADALVGARSVTIWRDKDTVGHERARRIAAALAKRNVPFRIVESPHAHDAADHLAGGHDLLDVREVDEETTPAHGLLVPLSEVEATYPDYDAETIVRRGGLHLWWGAPGHYKTYLALLLCLQMTQPDSDARVYGVEGFEIRRRWRRVGWLGDEESAGDLRARAEIIARGHGLRPPEGAEILFADASGGAVMLDISHIPDLVEAGKLDAIIVDPLANLTPPTDADGRPVKVDLDNTHALARICRPLRRLCKQTGVTALLLHHPNASGERERGPTAYRGSADVVVKVAMDGPNLALDFNKNRDGRRTKTYLEPVWTGYRDDADNPLTLRLEPVEAPVNEQGLPDVAAKILAAVRAAGPLTWSQCRSAAGRVAKSTTSRNLSLLAKRELVEKQPDGTYIAIEEMLPNDPE